MNNELEALLKKWSWYSPGICLEGLRKTTVTLGYDSQSLDRDLNPRHSEYEAEVLTTGPQCSVYVVIISSKQADCV
jgi:hypothetical protein